MMMCGGRDCPSMRPQLISGPVHPCFGRLALVFICVVCISCLFAPRSEAASEPQRLPAPLVYLRDVDATIVQDMRYATADNFTGRPVPGYGSPECVLLKGVAQALARVQKELAPKGLSLKVYDCYRPTQAVQAFVAWARDSRSNYLSRRFHPRTPKSRLFALGYIAVSSGHSRGTAVDLTLVRLPLLQAERYDPARAYGVCTQPANKRTPDSRPRHGDRI